MESQLWWARVLQACAMKAVYSTNRGGPAAEDSSPQAEPGVESLGRTSMVLGIKDRPFTFPIRPVLFSLQWYQMAGLLWLANTALGRTIYFLNKFAFNIV